MPCTRVLSHMQAHPLGQTGRKASERPKEAKPTNETTKVLRHLCTSWAHPNAIRVSPRFPEENPRQCSAEKRNTPRATSAAPSRRTLRSNRSRFWKRCTTHRQHDCQKFHCETTVVICRWHNALCAKKHIQEKTKRLERTQREKEHRTKSTGLRLQGGLHMGW